MEDTTHSHFISASRNAIPILEKGVSANNIKNSTLKFLWDIHRFSFLTSNLKGATLLVAPLIDPLIFSTVLQFSQ